MALEHFGALMGSLIRAVNSTTEIDRKMSDGNRRITQDVRDGNRTMTQEC